MHFKIQNMAGKRWSKIIIRVLLFVPLLLLIAFHVISAIMYYGDDDIIKSLPNATIEYITFEDATLRKVITGDREADTVWVFVHGAPGSWDAYKRYLSDPVFTSSKLMISYDRPAYGGSSGRRTADLKYHGEALNTILRPYSDKYVHAVGHSYGGPITTMAALVDTTLIDEVTMIAPVIDPDNEPMWWFSYFSFWPATRWMFPSDFKTAGIEKRDHAEALRSLDSLWGSWKVPVTHIHGYDDRLAPALSNVSYVEQRLADTLLTGVYLQEKGHLVLWTDYELVKEVLLK